MSEPSRIACAPAFGQKAPSAKRCIKTCQDVCQSGAWLAVRKHRAPRGALRQRPVQGCFNFVTSQKAPSAKRCIKTGHKNRPHQHVTLVRKHRAPKGALRRRQRATPLRRRATHQKAPSAKRCIKIVQKPRPRWSVGVRKHRAPKGALRRESPTQRSNERSESESTERQTVH